MNKFLSCSVKLISNLYQKSKHVFFVLFFQLNHIETPNNELNKFLSSSVNSYSKFPTTSSIYFYLFFQLTHTESCKNISNMLLSFSVMENRNNKFNKSISSSIKTRSNLKPKNQYVSIFFSWIIFKLTKITSMYFYLPQLSHI